MDPGVMESSPSLLWKQFSCRIVLEIQECLEDILSKVINPDHLQAGARLGVLQCNNLVMAMGSMVHILVRHPSITCHSILILATLPSRHLVVIPPTGTSQLHHQVSRLLMEVAMITMVNRVRTNSKTLVVLLHQRQIILVTIMVSHRLRDISRDKVILKMVTGVIMLLLIRDMFSHLSMTNSKVIRLQAMVM